MSHQEVRYALQTEQALRNVITAIFDSLLNAQVIL